MPCTANGRYDAIYRATPEGWRLSQANSGEYTKWPSRGKVRTRTRRKRAGMGQVAITRLDAYIHSEGHKPADFAGFSDWYTHPVIEASHTIRSETRRQKSEFGFDCPISIVPEAGCILTAFRHNLSFA